LGRKISRRKGGKIQQGKMPSAQQKRLNSLSAYYYIREVHSIISPGI
jgi:hypothetical protein